MPTLSERLAFGCPITDVKELLAVRPPTWMTPFVRIAAHAGEGIFEGSKPQNEQAAAQRTIVVNLEDPENLRGDSGSVVIGFTIEATGYDPLFRRLEGRIVLRPIGGRATAVELHAGYQGDDSKVDAVTRHRAVRATVRNLLQNLRAAVEEASRAPVRT